jgi:hypothetical protein
MRLLLEDMSNRIAMLIGDRRKQVQSSQTIATRTSRVVTCCAAASVNEICQDETHAPQQWSI